MQTSDPVLASDWKRFAAWWNSPAGPASLLAVALPLMISAGFVSLTLFTDRTLLYWSSESFAAAAMGGGTVYWSLICLPLGTLGYVSTFVAQYRGAKRFERIGAVYQHAWYLAIAMLPLLLIAGLCAEDLFHIAGHAPHLAMLEAGYLRILLIGGAAMLIYSVQSGLLAGDQRTATVLWIDAVATGANLLLDAVLVFGVGPIPAMGVLGAGIATAASFWMKVPLAAFCIGRIPHMRREYGIGCHHRWERGIWRRIIGYGAPAGSQMLAEAGCFSLILLQIGKLGDLQMAAATLALGINVLTFSPMVGLGVGVSILVGEQLTSQSPHLAKRSVRCGLVLAGLYTGTCAILLLAFPDAVVAVYSWGAEPQRFADIKPILLPLLKVLAAYCILDGLQVVFVGAIKGAGDTWFVLVATLIISMAALVIGNSVQSWYGSNLMLWWYVIAGWVTTMGVVFAIRYHSNRWLEKRVIDVAPEASRP